MGNAKQAASYYITRMGFRPVAYRGLETGSRTIASHVVENGSVRFVLTSPLKSSNSDTISVDDAAELEALHRHLNEHGDAVKDVAFEVDNVRKVYSRAIQNGAVSVSEPEVLSDENGEVVIASLKTYGDTIHTLVDRSRYCGTFMPGYRAVTESDPISTFLPKITLEAVDHCVGNQNWGEMEAACE